MKETNFDEFANNLKRTLSMKAENGTKIDIHETTKNNGVTYHAIAIMKKNCNISPNIRLDEFYRSYKEGMSIEEIADEIMDILDENKQKECCDLDFFTDFEKAKPHIMFKIIGYEKNRKRLQTIPHVKFLDLALTFYYAVELDDGICRNASIQIENGHLELWHIDTGILYDVAMENTSRKLPARCKTICDIIVDILREDGIEPLSGLEEEFRARKDDIPMYVLSNEKNYFGAAVIYYPGILKEIGKALHSDMIILPSSVHEVILLPVRGVEDYRSLNEMIRDINKEHVAREDVLSDHFYYYDLVRDELRLPPVM